MFASSPGSLVRSSTMLSLNCFAGAAIVFDRGWNLSACNQAALKLLGEPMDRLIGRHVDEVLLRVVWSDGRPWEAQRAMVATNTNQPQVNTGSRIVSCLSDNSVGCERWLAYLKLDEAGFPNGGVCIHQPAVSETCRTGENEIQRLRDFVESASDWFWETDAELRYTFFSERYREAAGVTPESRLGRRRGEHRLNGHNDGDWRAHIADLEHRRPFRDFEFAYLDANGKRRVARVSGRPVFDGCGIFLGYRGVGRDITEEVHAEERIRFLAQHDALTRLPNRTVFKDRLEQLLLRADRCHEGLAVLCVDLDDFKVVNDTLGHAAGDSLLCEAAMRMRETTRAMDTIARLGGDEFTVIQVNTRGSKDAEALASRLIAKMSEPFDINGEKIHCSASIGISIYPDDGVAADELMRHADLALYKAKSCGRDTYRFYTAEMDREVQERRQMEKELRDALSNDHFFLHYQPQINIATGSQTGYEALVRWQHPVRGFITPATFINAAERSGVIVAIDRWVLRQACRQAKAWKNAGLLPGRIAVNLSAVQLRRSDVVSYILAVLDESGLSPEDLEVEITESVLLIDSDATSVALNAISGLGISLAVDDFGTGYSSLTYLKKFPVSKVKIDRSFVHNLLRNEDDKAIARAIITLGHSLGLKVVAEGVEEIKQLECLRELGCDDAQGYLIAPPMPAAELARKQSASKGNTK